MLLTLLMLLLVPTNLVHGLKWWFSWWFDGDDDGDDDDDKANVAVTTLVNGCTNK